ncbi:MAG: long-chain fatty acid--CoA ligase [Calditrichaeota bacterium]|nr:MAG: long-chain fatty acid--CoA ligase [Calditrichota bacterium]
MQINETDWLKKWAEYSPQKFALREYHRNLEWTYFDFNQRVEALALHLSQNLGLKKGDRIAVYSQNRAEYVFLFFACVKLGTIIVPLNFRLMPRELDILLSDATPKLFIFEEEFASKVEQLKSLNKVDSKIAIESLSPFLTDPLSETSPLPCLPADENAAVMILYTAGTTGLSKGAIITHKMLFWNSINTELRLNITSADHSQGYAPFFHTGGWNVLFLPFIHHGASHTLLTGFDTDLILELLEKERSTIIFGVPTMMQMLSESPLFEKADLSSVRYAIVGGAPMPIPLINKWHEKGIMIRQGYGLTEVGPNCFSLHQGDAIRKQGSIGFPNFYIQAKIMADQSRECATDEVGELWMKSPVVTPGYWNKAEATKAAITDDWFHTGDMVRRDEEGYYYVVDRKKNMFISGGENVYPAEVESFLYTNSAIKEVVVIGVEDEKWGEVGKAVIVLHAGKKLSEMDVLQFCAGKLAKYKTPKYVEFVVEIPKNEAGKVNRKLIK